MGKRGWSGRDNGKGNGFLQHFVSKGLPGRIIFTGAVIAAVGLSIALPVPAMYKASYG